MTQEWSHCARISKAQKRRAVSSSTYDRLHSAPGPQDFLFGSLLGQGSYAKVFHAKLKIKSALYFAVKVMDQAFIRRENKIGFVLTERKVMTRLCHPLIVRFYCSFQDTQSLYIVMELCPGGNLLTLIRNQQRYHEDKGQLDTACTMEMTRFYMAELVIAIEFMHSKHVVHRDLKPENLLLSTEGHMKVIDFGTAKDEEEDGAAAATFGGSVAYLSPEVLKDEPASVATDLWALGCIIYEMLTGKTPFMAATAYETFKRITDHEHSDDIYFPSSIPPCAKDLIVKLLASVTRADPRDRLGACDGFEDLKRHAFFENIQWETLLSQEPPCYNPLPLDLPEPYMDGANKHWAVAGYFDSLSETRSSYSVSRCTSTRLPNGESLIKQSLVKVKQSKRFFRRTRQLLLTDRPRLLFSSIASGNVKQELLLTSEVRVQMLTKDTFEIRPSQSPYILHITDLSSDAEGWVHAITSVARIKQ